MHRMKQQYIAPLFQEGVCGCVSWTDSLCIGMFTMCAKVMCVGVTTMYRMRQHVGIGRVGVWGVYHVYKGNTQVMCV